MFGLLTSQYSGTPLTMTSDITTLFGFCPALCLATSGHTFWASDKADGLTRLTATDSKAARVAEGDIYSGSTEEDFDVDDDDTHSESTEDDFDDDDDDELAGEVDDDDFDPKSCDGVTPKGRLRRSGIKSSLPGLYLMSEVHWEISFMAFNAFGSWICNSGVFQLPMIGLWSV